MRKEPIRQCARWSREEEILLTQCWIETSENGQIGADRSEDSFWGQIMDDFNTGTTQDVRPRPAGKNRRAKKTKSKTTGSTGGNASGSLSDYVSEDLRRKLQAETSAYEAKKEKEVAMMEFLTIDADLLSEPKASIIRNRQEKIIAKYAQQ
ncbi:hypothetical protein Tco_0571212 [Tanacetum coccineum]